MVFLGFTNSRASEWVGLDAQAAGMVTVTSDRLCGSDSKGVTSQTEKSGSSLSSSTFAKFSTFSSL